MNRVLLAGVACALLGCSESRDYYLVSGRVQADGQPVDEGSITFTPTSSEAGQHPVSADIAGGAYEIAPGKKMAAGSYRVSITAERPTGKRIETDPGSGQFTQTRVQYLPPRYNARTELTAEVTGDNDALDFELSLSGRR